MRLGIFRINSKIKREGSVGYSVVQSHLFSRLYPTLCSIKNNLQDAVLVRMPPSVKHVMHEIS